MARLVKLLAALVLIALAAALAFAAVRRYEWLRVFLPEEVDELVPT